MLSDSTSPITWRCMYCGKNPCTCNGKNYESKGILGWICPVCGTGMSPYATQCPCQQKFEISYYPQDKITFMSFT